MAWAATPLLKRVFGAKPELSDSDWPPPGAQRSIPAYRVAVVSPYSAAIETVLPWSLKLIACR